MQFCYISQGGEGTKNCDFLQSRGTKKILRRNLHDTINIPFPVVGNIINAYPTHLGTKHDPCFNQQHTASRAVIFNQSAGTKCILHTAYCKLYFAE